MTIVSSEGPNRVTEGEARRDGERVGRRLTGVARVAHSLAGSAEVPLVAVVVAAAALVLGFPVVVAAAGRHRRPRSATMAAEAEEQPQGTPQEEVAEEKPEETPEETPEEESAEEEEEAPAEEEEEEEEEEVVDPKAEIENSCKPKCVKQLLALQACETRVDEDEGGHKHCTGQYFDYWGCIDKCTAPKLFRKLK